MAKTKKKKPPTAAAPPSKAPPWADLPSDITANIMGRLGAVDILENAQRVCTTWRAASKDPATWRTIHIKHPGYTSNFDLLCRDAVDRSQGQLTEFHMENMSVTSYVYNGTLLYVLQRSPNLRRLLLSSCEEISGEALTEAVKKLPLLEELHLIDMPNVRPGHVKAIGNSCPNLKSFTFNLHGRRRSRYPSSLGSEEDDYGEWDMLVDDLEDEDLPEDLEDDDDYFVEDETPLGCKHALAVAKSMPNLRHLQFLANFMRNDALQAILDGCPHIESLDIRQCWRVDLTGILGERCFQQIKNIRLPNDSVDDYKWYAGEIKTLFDYYYRDPSSSDDDLWYLGP